MKLMNEAELKAQRNKALANYELKKMLVRANRATADDVAEAKRIYEALRDYKPADPVAIPTAAVETVKESSLASAPAPAIVIPAMAVSEFTQLIEDLTIERHEALKQMCLRSNRLGDYPDETNLKELVNEIQEWKAKRNAVAEKIAYLRLNGRLPQPSADPAPDHGSDCTKSAFLANLPADRYELNKVLVNSLQPKLYRAKKSLAAAKSEIWIAHYRKEVAKAQAAVDLAKNQLSAMA
ncbi:hypothetical protein [Larkinella punicea]|uniref:Uncharacterized protein n=1 Tax=Larkinella punicea TaxID=2315727 RepID=A0A368JP27_9BACT|nr:hypothetical protein [Larkinella punicea]RCR69420.1 hypothetical protein DUE52_11245 [Larkinella punicea]